MVVYSVHLSSKLRSVILSIIHSGCIHDATYELSVLNDYKHVLFKEDPMSGLGLLSDYNNDSELSEPDDKADSTRETKTQVNIYHKFSYFIITYV
jgi:hypothetical protein